MAAANRRLKSAGVDATLIKSPTSKSDELNGLKTFNSISVQGLLKHSDLDFLHCIYTVCTAKPAFKFLFYLRSGECFNHHPPRNLPVSHSQLQKEHKASLLVDQ